MQVDLGGSCTCISAVLDAASGRGDVEVEDGPRVSFLASREPVSIVSAGERARLSIRGVQRFSHLLLRFEPETLADLVEEPVDTSAAFRTRPLAADAPLLALCRLFANECADRNGSGSLYGDSLSVALLLRLAQLGDGGTMPARSSGLSPWQLRRVLEHIEAHYADEVPIDTLAGLARLSASHFSRAFKRSAGVSPHQWLVALRCTKAKQMLLDGRLPLADIAAATGFSDQSHFTRAFGQSNGVPPATWRRMQMPG